MTAGEEQAQPIVLDARWILGLGLLRRRCDLVRQLGGAVASQPIEIGQAGRKGDVTVQLADPAEPGAAGVAPSAGDGERK